MNSPPPSENITKIIRPKYFHANFEGDYGKITYLPRKQLPKNYFVCNWWSLYVTLERMILWELFASLIAQNCRNGHKNNSLAIFCISFGRDVKIADPSITQLLCN